MDRLQRSPQTRLVASVAPSSTSLYGQTLALALTTLDSPILQKSPTTTPSARKALAPMAAFRQTMASLMVAPGPTWTSAQRTLPSMSAPVWITEPAPMTQLARRAPGATWTPRPRMTDPESFAV